MATSSMSTAASPPASDGVAIVVMGVSGSGKTTVGVRLANALRAQFIDGDDLHTDAARAKMKSGHPLTDEDRWPWLDRIGAALAQGRRTVVACSALRRAYRDVLLGGRPAARLVFLQVSHDQDEDRLTARHGHFFPAKLLDSQFAALEMPQDSERAVVPAAGGSPADVVADIIAALGLTAGPRPYGKEATMTAADGTAANGTAADGTP